MLSKTRLRIQHVSARSKRASIDRVFPTGTPVFDDLLDECDGPSQVRGKYSVLMLMSPEITFEAKFSNSSRLAVGTLQCRLVHIANRTGLFGVSY
jgi:hypothetical protein